MKKVIFTTLTLVAMLVAVSCSKESGLKPSPKISIHESYLNELSKFELTDISDVPKGPPWSKWLAIGVSDAIGALDGGSHGAVFGTVGVGVLGTLGAASASLSMYTNFWPKLSNIPSVNVPANPNNKFEVSGIIHNEMLNTYLLDPQTYQQDGQLNLQYLFNRTKIEMPTCYSRLCPSSSYIVYNDFINNQLTYEMFELVNYQTPLWVNHGANAKPEILDWMDNNIPDSVIADILKTNVNFMFTAHVKHDAIQMAVISENWIVANDQLTELQKDLLLNYFAVLRYSISFWTEVN